MAVHDETGGGFFDKPGLNKFIAQLGLGMIMGGMAQPYGKTRGQAMAPYFKRAVKSMFPSEDEQLKRRYLKGQIGEMESKAQKRKSQSRAQRELLQWYRGQDTLKRFGRPQQPGAAPAPSPGPLGRAARERGHRCPWVPLPRRRRAVYPCADRRTESP